jgi:nucleotide-binding universal stress UspA family protein
MTTRLEQASNIGGVHAFAHILVGIDGSGEALEAARQAARFAGSDGRLTLLAAWDLAPPLAQPWGAEHTTLEAERPHTHAESALRDATAHLALHQHVETETTCGSAWRALIAAAQVEGHDLIAVGSHGDGRAIGILAGSTTTELVHKAPCSVLVARRAGDDFPRKIVVGIDGSKASGDAFVVASRLSAQFGAELWPVVARGGRPPEKRLVALITERYEVLPDSPVSALIAAAADADLIVVGSRGLHGLKALGSVSERVAHEARCSTLIVRAEHSRP